MVVFFVNHNLLGFGICGTSSGLGQCQVLLNVYVVWCYLKKKYVVLCFLLCFVNFHNFFVSKPSDMDDSEIEFLCNHAPFEQQSQIIKKFLENVSIILLYGVFGVRAGSVHVPCNFKLDSLIILSEP